MVFPDTQQIYSLTFGLQQEKVRDWERERGVGGEKERITNLWQIIYVCTWREWDWENYWWIKIKSTYNIILTKVITLPMA